MNTVGRVAISALLAVTLFVSGCGHEHCDGEPTLTAVPHSATTVAAGGSITLHFETTNFDFTGEDHHHVAPSTVQYAGESSCITGHVHVYLDDLNVNPLAMVLESSADIVIPAGTPAGDYTLLNRLHDANHFIIEPQIIDQVAITVQ